MTNDPNELRAQLGIDPHDSFDLIVLDGSVIALTQGRLIVQHGSRITLDVPIEEIRRVQLDIEANQPAALVVVPHSPTHEPEVLMVPRTETVSICRILTALDTRWQ